MRFLKRNFQLVRFEADWSELKGPAVAVTFDDGYADNALEGLPILEEVGVPATFFVSTGTLGTREEFWWDELERIILAGDLRPASFSLVDHATSRSWPTANKEERLALHQEIHPLLASLDRERREEWLAQLRVWAGLDATGREGNRSLTTAELKTLAASPWVTVGAHTVSHTSLALLSEAEQRREIGGSKEELERLLGKDVTVFSYPFGTKAHYNKTSLRLCREAGFVKVAANFPGQAHRWTYPCQIPRQLARNWDDETISAMINGFWA
jgi:peptidoglycan/xylan/chitin deacetylase (PgdA/CDA1 family)